MKIELELVVNDEPDGRKFLNFWSVFGGDVCCQVIDGKLFEDDDNCNPVEITLDEFINKVSDVVKTRYPQ